MFNRLVVTLNFDNLPQAQGAVAHLRTLLPFCHDINPHLDNFEASFIQLEECFHDEDPPFPCSVIVRYDKSNP